MAKSMRPVGPFSRDESGLNDRHVQGASDVQDREEPQRPRKRKTFSPVIFEARMQKAADLRAVLEEFNKDKLQQFSLATCARLAQVNESIFSDYVSGEKPMPYGIEELLPWPIVRRLRERSDARRAKRGDS